MLKQGLKMIKYSLLAIALMVSAPLAATAQEISCDSTYTTQRGDSLSRIAERAYGSPSAYQKIFSVNPGKLRSVNVVPIGIDLYIPCADGSGTNQLAAISSGTSNNIRLLTGGNYAPYVGKDLPNGGFSTELLNRALQSKGQEADYRIDVINDWGSHLQPLLSDGLYDIGYPWFRPDCDKYDLLGEASQWRCDNLRFSDPLHEIVVTAYGPKSAPDINQPSDAVGLTICRPAGFFTHDLEAFGLTADKITRESPTTATDCFELLRDGKVDLVTVNADTADQIIDELNMRDLVDEQDTLSTVQTLRAVGMRSNPNSRIILRRINQGLRQLKDSGDFRSIAANHL
ncbi:transporter substrate-binding domain-containing protein [Sulfitobacter sp. PS-8MA]|uniref:transporter substrate-binding domain-containing protein n=1 Tax=Sulfitobacter sp. PS-8MA TaxID=3237707 RepID=UPI0034C5B27A